MMVRAFVLVVFALTLAACAKQKAQPAAGASYATELARVEAKTDRALGVAVDDTAPQGAPASEEAPALADDAQGASAKKQSSAELSVPERRALLEEAERVFSSESAPSTPPVTLLRQDLAERSARVALSLGEPEEALRWIERGLAIERAPSLVLANLLVGRADVLEALGRPDEARSSLVEALGVNQALLAQELAD